MNGADLAVLVVPFLDGSSNRVEAGTDLESVLAGDQPGESSSSYSEDEVVVRKIFSQMRDCFEPLIRYVDATNDSDIQGLHEHH